MSRIHSPAPSTLRKLTRELRSRRAAMLRVVDGLHEEASDALAHVDLSDLLDGGAAAGAGTEESLLLAETVEALIGEIDEALERIERGSYGICLDCAGSIPVARLKALPFTAVCVDCKRSRDRDGDRLGVT